jgi:hypothetical protein
VKPSNHIETPLKTPIPNIRSISPQTIQALKEKNANPNSKLPYQFPLLLLLPLLFSLAFVLIHGSLQQKKNQKPQPPPH